MYKRILKLVQGVLHVYKKALNDVKMVLYSEQFGLEVTSNGFAHFVTMTKLLHRYLFIYYFALQIICLSSILFHRSRIVFLRCFTPTKLL